MLIEVFQQRFVGCDSEGKMVDSKCPDNVRLEVKLSGTVRCQKTAVVEPELILDFTVLSIDEVNVKFMVADIFAEILTSIKCTSSTRIRSQSFSKEYFCYSLFQPSKRGVSFLSNLSERAPNHSNMTAMEGGSGDSLLMLRENLN